MRIAITALASLLVATTAFAQVPPAAGPTPPPASADAPSVGDPAPATADAQQPAASAQSDPARAERCRAQRNTESRLRSSRRQRCPVAPRADAAGSPVDTPTQGEEPAQSPTLPPVSQQPH